MKDTGGNNGKLGCPLFSREGREARSLRDKIFLSRDLEERAELAERFLGMAGHFLRCPQSGGTRAICKVCRGMASYQDRAARRILSERWVFHLRIAWEVRVLR